MVVSYYEKCNFVPILEKIPKNILVIFSQPNPPPDNDDYDDDMEEGVGGIGQLSLTDGALDGLDWVVLSMLKFDFENFAEFSHFRPHLC